MSITVATVALNAATELPATLESALLQDHADLEVIVVDGASTDETPAVLARYADEVRVLVVEDSGIFDAMNRAAAVASKETIIFMNAGDRFHTARSLSKLWARRGGADIVYGKHVYRENGVDTLKPARDIGEHVAALRAGLVSWEWLAGFPAHQATLTRTELLRRLRFDTAFRMAADHDLMMRAHGEGAAIRYVDEIVCVYSGGGVSGRRRELTSRELNAIYRAQSERPDAVDDLFFAESSPFKGTRSPYAGDAVAGLIPFDEANRGTLPMPGEFRWASGRGFRLRSPVHRWVEALTLSGWNEVPRQVLEVYTGGERAFRRVIDVGPMNLEIEFDPRLAPGSIIDVVPRIAVRVAGRPEIVSVAIGEFGFRFVEALRPLTLGVRFETTATGGREAAMALVAGWWAPERTHVWSKKAGEMRLVSTEDPREIAVAAFSNPALEGQRVAVFVNDAAVGTAALERHATTSVFPVRDLWRGGGAENRVRFVPSEVARVGADPRDLGFGLASVTLS